MAHHSADERPLPALAALPAIALPGGADGAPGPPTSCAGELGSGAWRPVAGLVGVASAAKPGPSWLGVAASRRGARANGRSPVAAPAALR
jgi:hypothetical protein